MIKLCAKHRLYVIPGPYAFFYHMIMEQSACLRKLEKGNEEIAEIIYLSSFGETDLSIFYVYAHLPKKAMNEAEDTWALLCNIIEFLTCMHYILAAIYICSPIYVAPLSITLAYRMLQKFSVN